MDDPLLPFREVLTCVVCLEILVPPLVQCERGHAICSRCKGGQRQCPSCRHRLLKDKPILLCQLLEVVSDRCKYPGCRYVLADSADDHRTWCGFRPSRCKLCTWSGSSNAVFNHVRQSHGNFIVFGPTENVANRFLHSTQPYVPFSASNLFFWIQLKSWNLSWERSNSVAFKFILVPTKKIPNDLYIHVRYRTENSEMTLCKRVEVDPKEEFGKNFVFIPEFVIDGNNDFLSVQVGQRDQEAPVINNLSVESIILQLAQNIFQAIKRKVNEQILLHQGDIDEFVRKMKIICVSVLFCIFTLIVSPKNTSNKY